MFILLTIHVCVCVLFLILLARCTRTHTSFALFWRCPISWPWLLKCLPGVCVKVFSCLLFTRVKKCLCVCVCPFLLLLLFLLFVRYCSSSGFFFFFGFSTGFTSPRRAAPDHRPRRRSRADRWSSTSGWSRQNRPGTRFESTCRYPTA